MTSNAILNGPPERPPGLAPDHSPAGVSDAAADGAADGASGRSDTDIAGAIAQRAVARREAQYTDEVRRLLDGALSVMRDCGTASSPRVADIVAAAGLSNDAFYRHFASKEALVAAILEDGSVRLVSYLRHQMAKETTPRAQVRRWVEGVMAQAGDEKIAATTRAVLWNGGRLSERAAQTRPGAAASLATLLHEPFAAIGSADPEADAALVAHAAVGLLSDLLWQRSRATDEQIDHIVAFCMAAVNAEHRASAPTAASARPT